MNELRPELPELPDRMKRLHVDSRGYPVPWFVVWLNERGRPVLRGQGKPDFRILHPRAFETAVTFNWCWVCGQPMGFERQAFVIGPMCAVNRTSAEPPSHVECADFSARACPFLARPHARRREAGMPEGREVPGVMLGRNPGVAGDWVTERGRWRVFKVSNGLLVNIGEPTEVRWYAEGREAKRAEVQESIDTGYPALLKVAEEEGAVDELEACVERAMPLLPVA